MPLNGGRRAEPVKPAGESRAEGALSAALAVRDAGRLALLPVPSESRGVGTLAAPLAGRDDGWPAP